MTELLKSLGYTAGSVVILLGVAYLARGLFESLLKSIVAADFERVQQQNRIDLAEIKKQYDDELQQKRAALDREIERFKSGLTVQTETFRSAGEERFKCLMNLWEKSESLLRGTDFSNPEEIKQKLSNVETAANELDRKSVLLSPVTVNDIRVYLEELKKVFTSTEKALEDGVKQNETKQNVPTNTPDIPVTVSMGLFGITFDLGSVVKFASKYLNKTRLKVANEARSRLADALRREFGVLPTHPEASADENYENRA